MTDFSFEATMRYMITQSSSRVARITSSLRACSAIKTFTQLTLVILLFRLSKRIGDVLLFFNFRFLRFTLNVRVEEVSSEKKINK